MRAGELKDRVIIQKRTDVRDNHGDIVPTWTEFASRRCAVLPQSGSEGYRNRHETQSYSHTLELRHIPGVRTKWRALWRTTSRTTLTGRVTDSGTSFLVSSADEFPPDAPFLALCGSEIVQVSSGMGTTTWTVTRAQNGSTARIHGADVSIHLLTALDIESVAHIGQTTYLGCQEGEPGRGA